MNPITLDTGEQIDPQVHSLFKAIRQKESGGNYGAVGDSGTSTGAFQYQPNTWKLYAKEVLGDENAQQDKTNQNKVAYTKMKRWKDSGFTPEQVAAAWNAGEQKAVDGSWQTNIGHNERLGVDYNTPQYVNDVISIAKANKQGDYNPTPFSNPKGKEGQAFSLDTSGLNKPEISQEPGLMGKLGGRLNDISTNVSDIATKFTTGQSQQNPISNVIQAGGAVAGGVNDVIGAGLELIPGVKQAEGAIGKGIGKLAETSIGQEAIKGAQSFQQAHPEIAKDIMAGVDIATSIPLLKGLGVAKDVAVSGARGLLGGALGERAIIQAERELTNTLTTATGKKALAQATSRGLQPMKILGSMAIPVEDGKYVAGKEIMERLDSAISNIDENVLKPAVESVSTQRVAQRASMEDIKNTLLQTAEDEMAGSGKLSTTQKVIKTIIEENKLKYGDYPTLDNVIDMKRRIAKEISDAGFNSPDYSVNKIIRNGLQDYSETMAEKLGLPDIGKINKSMSELINAQKMLKYIDGKKATVGKFASAFKNVATAGGAAAGEGLGNAFGLPFMGTLTGGGLGRIGGKALEKKTAGGLLRGFVKPKI